MSDSTSNEINLAAVLESLLFVAAEPIAPSQLASVLDINVTAVEKGLADLEEYLKTRGLRLQRHAGRVQLTTAPEVADVVERFLGLEATTRLSRARKDIETAKQKRQDALAELANYKSVLKSGETATPDEIIKFCEERLAPYKVPKQVEFRSELPKTMVGKFLRRVLVEEDRKKMAQ